MLNRLARFLLVASALSPVLGAVAVNRASLGVPWTGWLPWVGAALGLVAACALLLRHAARSGQREPLRVARLERSDREALAFLLAYLLPFVAREATTFTGDVPTSAYVLAVVLLTFLHADAYHFNPVLGLLGYRFYAVDAGDGVPRLLVTRRPQRRAGLELPTVQVAPGIHLLVDDPTRGATP